MTSEQKREYDKLYMRRRRKTHPEEGRAACKRWREKNRKAELLRNRLKGKKYRDLNKAKQAEYMRIWRAENRARMNELQNRRKARKLSTQIDPSGIAKWMKEMRSLPYVRCHWCGTKVRGKQIRFDHVIALARGGAHSISNLCASCNSYNSSKSARAIADWIVNGQTFLPI